MISLLAVALLQAAAGAPDAPPPGFHIERRCTSERTGGATRTARARVCRNVVVADDPTPVEVQPAEPSPMPVTVAPPFESEVGAALLAGVFAFNRHDLEAVLAQFDANAELYTATGWVRGADAIRQRFQQTFQLHPNAQRNVTDLRIRALNADTAIVDYTWSVTNAEGAPPATGVSSAVYVRTPTGWRAVLEHETPR